jgi:hypothetical protein
VTAACSVERRIAASGAPSEFYPIIAFGRLKLTMLSLPSFARVDHRILLKFPSGSLEGTIKAGKQTILKELRNPERGMR